MSKLLRRFGLSLLGMSLIAGLLAIAPLFVKPADAAADRAYVPNAARLVSLVQPQKAEAGCVLVPSGPFSFVCGNYRRFVARGWHFIKMCHNWTDGSSNFGRYYSNVCSGAASIWTQDGHRYTKSDLGWSDTDGFYVPSGYNVYYARVYNNWPDGDYKIKYETGWHKIGGCGECLTKVKRVAHN